MVQLDAFGSWHFSWEPRGSLGSRRRKKTGPGGASPGSGDDELLTLKADLDLARSGPQILSL